MPSFVRHLTPWASLTRRGVPPFRVIRRPITTKGVTINVGEELPAGTFATPMKLRALYEQRLIEPVEAPPNSVQAHRERKKETVATAAPAVTASSTEVTPLISADIDVPLDTDVPAPIPDSRPRGTAGSSSPSSARHLPKRRN